MFKRGTLAQFPKIVNITTKFMEIDKQHWVNISFETRIIFFKVFYIDKQGVL